MFAYAGFAVGIMVTLRAAFFAYIGASILGLVWALFTRLKASEFANRVFFILGVILIIFGTVNVFKPHENVALVGSLEGKIGIISGTPQHVTDTVRYGDFLNSEPEKPFKIRSLKSLDQARKLIDNTVAEFIKNGPTSQELKRAKDFMIGGFPLKLDSNKSILEYVSMMAFYKYPLDYLETFTKKIDKISAEEIKSAFQRRVDMSKFSTVIVGSE